MLFNNYSIGVILTLHYYDSKTLQVCTIIIFIVEVDKVGYVGNAKGEYRGLYLEPNKDRALSIAPTNLLLEKGEKK